MRVKPGLLRPIIFGVLSLVAMLLLPPTLRAQVAGTVRDSASQIPLPGTAVMVLDPSGRAVARSVTDQQGHFRLATTVGKGTGRAARRRCIRSGSACFAWDSGRER